MTTLTVDGKKVRLQGNPQGRLLLIHGAGEDSDVFRTLLDHLPDAFAPDLPGHGASQGGGCDDVTQYAQWVGRLLREMGASPPAVGGHSMGGAITLALALDGPYPPRALALIATGARLRVHPDLLSALAGGTFPLAFRQAYLGPDAPQDLLDAMGGAPVPVTHGDFLACDRFDVLSRLGEIHVPTFVAVGTEDKYTPQKYARTLADTLGGELTLFPGAGHLLPMERPRELGASLADFVAAIS